MSKRKKKYVVVNRKRLISAISICVVIIIGGSISIVKYIKSVNKRNEIMYSKKAAMDKQTEERTTETDDGKDKVKTVDEEEIKKDSEVTENKNESKENFLSTSVFLGDSITEGFSFYSLVDSNRILAKKGDTTIKAMEYISSVKDINPKNIFILYGMNDLVNFQNNEDFIMSYSNLIENIKKEVSEAHIYVQSVLPIASSAEDTSLNLTNARIDEVNTMILSMCVEKNINYIDISKGLKANESLFEPDGKHVKADFYNVWLDDIKNNL